MDVVTLLHKAHQAGMTLQAEGEKLHVRGPRSAAPLVDLLAEHKLAILDVLHNSRAGKHPVPRQSAVLSTEDLPEYWREMYEERAAIREYEGGQAREHAEAEALRETIEAMQAAGIIDPDK